MGCLHRDFAEWAIAHDSVPCTRETFAALLEELGFLTGEIQGTFLVSGLFLKDDAESLVQYLKPFIQTEVEMQKTTKGAMHMAKSVNKVILLGNVGKDPEIRSTPGGATVASFTLATSDRQMDAQGNWTDKTEW